MTNLGVAAELRTLRSEFAGGRLTMEDIGRAFERLTYEFDVPCKGDDDMLRSFVNDIELIRYGLLPERQVAAVQNVLDRAQELFDELVD